jgi:hypothetical protein
VGFHEPCNSFGSPVMSYYGLYGRGSIRSRGKYFPSSVCFQFCPGFPPSLLSNGYLSSFPRVKVRPGRDADHSPSSSAEVKSNQELYLLSPKLLHGVQRDSFLYLKGTVRSFK